MSLAERYLSLLEYCRSAEFDRGIFKTRADEYAKRFARASGEEQGEASASIHAALVGEI